MNSSQKLPRLTHLEFYYGFFGVALTWQIVYFLISKDPLRYRPMMLAGALAKLSFFAACMVLFYTGRLMPGGALYGSLIDAGLAIVFVISFALGMDRRAEGQVQRRLVATALHATHGEERLVENQPCEGGGTDRQPEDGGAGSR